MKNPLYNIQEWMLKLGCYNQVLHERVERELLMEDIYSSPQNRRAIKYAMSKGHSKEEAKKLVDSIMSDFEIHHSHDPRFKFMLGLMRLVIEGGLQNNYIQNVRGMKNALKYIVSAHLDDYDENLNGEDVNTLINRFKELSQTDAQQSRDEVNKGQYQNQGYNIVKIDDANTCEQYSEFTSWCITDGAFGDYKLDTINQCYFCLRNGFENVEKVEGENCPLDEYGLSMVSVIVGDDGEPLYITTRWNHEHNGENNPNLRTASQVSQVIGVNFYETFKPKPVITDEERNEAIIPLLNKARTQHSRNWKDSLGWDMYMKFGGQDNIYDIDSDGLIEFKGRMNYITDDGRLLFPHWYTNVEHLEVDDSMWDWDTDSLYVEDGNKGANLFVLDTEQWMLPNFVRRIEVFHKYGMDIAVCQIDGNMLSVHRINDGQILSQFAGDIEPLHKSRLLFLCQEGDGYNITDIFGQKLLPHSVKEIERPGGWHNSIIRFVTHSNNYYQMNVQGEITDKNDNYINMEDVIW